MVFLSFAPPFHVRGRYPVEGREAYQLDQIHPVENPELYRSLVLLLQRYENPVLHPLDGNFGAN